MEVTTHEAKTKLSQLIARVLDGEEVVILRGREPVARLVPIQSKAGGGRPQVGTVTSEGVTWTEGAFAPLSETELEEWGL